jgi:hypothetical protein
MVVIAPYRRLPARSTQPPFCQGDHPLPPGSCLWRPSRCSRSGSRQDGAAELCAPDDALRRFRDGPLYGSDSWPGMFP